MRLHHYHQLEKLACANSYTIELKTDKIFLAYDQTQHLHCIVHYVKSVDELHLCQYTDCEYFQTKQEAVKAFTGLLNLELKG